METYDRARAGRATRGTPFPAVFTRAWLPLLLCCLGLVLCAGALAAEDPAKAAPPAISILPGDGMNLHLVEQVNPHYVVVKVDPPVHNWFAGTFTDLPTDGEVTIGLSMQGMDTKGNKANVSKWRGLRPVMTYGDPTKYETYEWYQKDAQGRWVSGDPFKQGEAKFAGTGKVPEQTAIPAELAAHFLSADGKYWQPWREVDHAETVPSLNIFRMKQRFAQPTATVAMRVPYTCTYLQAVVEKIRGMGDERISVDEIGKTINGRSLYVIRVDETRNPIKLKYAGIRLTPYSEKIPDIRIGGQHVVEQPTHISIIYGREHGTEHASSWVVHGLLSQSLDNYEPSRNRILLIIPIMDPDAASGSVYSNLIDRFEPRYAILPQHENRISEVTAYVTYFRAFFYSGRVPTEIISLHNVECTELPVAALAVVQDEEEKVSYYFTRLWFDLLKQISLPTTAVDNPIWGIGRADSRLFGFCYRNFGAIPMVYEVNDRYPASRLAQNDIMQLGKKLYTALTTYQGSDIFVSVKKRALHILSERKKQRESYAKEMHLVDNDPTLFFMISYGF